MNYLVAVSGGVDSVVLLDMLSKTDHRLVVAHVDHGIRGAESAADARFVQALAAKYQLPFVSCELKLGRRASEATAREGRYKFLIEQAKKFHACIVTAHHQDDLVETIALNITRGTGWRGLAVLARDDIKRPLLALTKTQIYNYALRHKLEWVEDATNRTDAYLRNRLRRRIAPTLSAKSCARLVELRARQLQLRREIDRETARLLTGVSGSRYFLNQVDTTSAIELLGAEFAQIGVRPTRPQIVRALHAIKVGKPGSTHDIGAGQKLTLTSRKYRLSVV